MHEAAELDENLIPIRLDVDLEGHRLRDTITWNKNGKYLDLVVTGGGGQALEPSSNLS